MKTLLPLMFGPVRIMIWPPAGSSVTSFGVNGVPPRFQHRMAAVDDREREAVVHLGPHVPALVRDLGQRRERVETADRAGRAQQGRGRRRDLGAHLAEELELEPPDALLGAEDPALVLLQLGRDVALGPDQGLPAQVVGRDLGPVDIAHLDRVAEDAIESDLQGGDAGSRALPLLERGDPLLALSRRLLELPQIRIPALPDQPAFPEDERRLVLEGLFKEFLKVGERRDLLGEGAQQGAAEGSERLREPRQAAQKAPQGDEVPGVGDAEGGAAGEALQVPHALQAPPEPVPGGRGVDQGGDRLLAAEDGLAVEQRAKHPLAEQAGAHGGGGGVERGKQRPPGGALLSRLEELESGHRGRVEQHRLAGDQALDSREMRQRLALGLAQVREGGAGGLQPGGERPHAEGVEAGAPEVRLEHLARRAGPEGPAVHARDGNAGRHPPRDPRGVGALREQQLGGAAQERRLEEPLPRARLLAHPEVAGGHVHERDPDRGRGRVRGEEKVVARAVQELGVGDRARGDDAHDVAAHDLAALGGLLELLAHRHLLARADEARDVAVGGVMGDARHRDRALALLSDVSVSWSRRAAVWASWKKSS